MLHSGKVIQALEARRDRFTAFDVEIRGKLDRYCEAFEALAQRSRAEFEAALSRVDHPGALPTAEHDDGSSLTVPFSESWSNHQEARAWARDVLAGVPTFAADGSQIQAQKDYSIPVAVVQVGWFENPHDGARSYEKNVHVDVLPPDELFDEEERGETTFPDWQVNLHRFELEIRVLIDYMEAHRKDAVKPLCFFDGSLVISFVQHMRPERQSRYIRSVCRLLAASERYRVPLVGYVDTSYANDLTSMLAHLNGWGATQRVSDAVLLRSYLSWGDRSHVYICARDDNVLHQYRDPDDGRSYADQACFIYLQTTRDNPPARLDFPRWMYEAGEVGRTIDIVRAECVVGNGYPYALETADAVAVLTVQDRERFYRLFQEFVEREGLRLRFSRKAVSKRRRR